MTLTIFSATLKLEKYRCASASTYSKVSGRAYPQYPKTALWTEPSSFVVAIANGQHNLVVRFIRSIPYLQVGCCDLLDRRNELNYSSGGRDDETEERSPG